MAVLEPSIIWAAFFIANRIDNTWLQIYAEREPMNNCELALVCCDVLPDGYLDEIKRELADTQVTYEDHEFELQPYASLEWVVPTFVAIYIAKPFFDAIMKRASEDVAESIYPRIKNAVISLAKKANLSDKIPFTRINKDRTTESSPPDAIFSVLAETAAEQKLKFVFEKRYTEDEYAECIDKAFEMLYENHLSGDATDGLSVEIGKLHRNRGHSTVYLTFDANLRHWVARDIIQEAIDKANRTG